MQENDRQYWEDMYGTPIDDLPWEIKEAPVELREYVEFNRGAGGTALDAGCGTGNFSMYLAQNGFEVTGVDYSERAIAVAKEKAAAAGLPIMYLRADLTSLSKALPDAQFDLVLDYKVVHHLPDDKLAQYVEQLKKLLKLKGRLLLICYANKDARAADSQPTGDTLGHEMLYRSAEEIRKFFQDFIEVSYKEVMLGKRLNYAGHCFVFER